MWGSDADTMVVVFVVKRTIAVVQWTLDGTMTHTLCAYTNAPPLNSQLILQNVDSLDTVGEDILCTSFIIKSR